ncbi:MAG TPA: PLP-dependent aminotransferase family protein [Jiangellaceae bacterium]|nr:PLP-dependent aminotransferase family protein [Jiangellaceae bacterium]
MRSVSGPHLARLLGTWNAAADHTPTYARLAAAIRMLVLDGRLALATRLPGERELAGALDVSRTTVTAAYDALRGDGYAASRQGSGTWTTLPAAPSGSHGPVPFAPAPETSGLLDLAHASPEAPATALREAYEWALAQLPRFVHGHGYSLFGIPELRAAIAERYTARGLPTAPDEILVTSGAQHAFSLAVSLFADPGDRILVEHPTYPNALDAIRRATTRPVPVPLTDDGWDLDAVEAALRQTAPRMAYLNPDFQNPTGLLATETERAALARAVTRSRTRTIIDETLVELSLDDDAMPAPLASYLRDDLAITTGTASKTFWGGIRVGWLRADRTTVRHLAAVRATVDNSTALVEQLAVTHLLGRIHEIRAERRAELTLRRDTLVAALAARLPEWQLRVPRGGLVFWCDIGAPVSSALAAAGERHGVRLAAGPRFGVDGAFERWLRVPYTLPADLLIDATDRIAAAYHSTAGEHPADRGQLVDAFA